MRHVTDTNYRKGSLCPNKKRVAKQKNVNLLTAKIGIWQKILRQEAMRPHLGNRPTGSVSTMGEAGTHCPISRARNTSKFQTTIFVWMSGCSNATENNKNKCLPFHNRLYLVRINFYKVCNRHDLPKTKYMANYKQKSWKTKNLNFSWGQIFAFFISHLQ